MYVTNSQIENLKHMVSTIPVFNQKIPANRLDGSCLFSQMTPLQIVAKVPGKAIPIVLWDNKVPIITS